MSGCRIGKIRMKGGATVYRLPEPIKDEMRTALIGCATKMATTYNPGEMAGYAMVAWAKDGKYNTGYRWTEASIVGPGLMPSFVSDALRRRMIESGEWES